MRVRTRGLFWIAALALAGLDRGVAVFIADRAFRLSRPGPQSPVTVAA